MASLKSKRVQGSRQVCQPHKSARAVLKNSQEDHQIYQKICMIEEGTFGIGRLIGNTREEDGGARNRSLKTNHARAPCYSLEYSDGVCSQVQTMRCHFIGSSFWLSHTVILCPSYNFTICWWTSVPEKIQSDYPGRVTTKGPYSHLEAG